MKDFYYILGVDADCSSGDIKDAYRKLSKKFHPDLNAGDAYFENRFREVQEAYDVLSDPFRREQYDIELKNDSPSSNQQHKARASSFKKYKRRGPGIGMSIVLALVFIIIGVYMVKWFNNTKNKTIYPATAIAGNAHAHRKHKKKSHLKNSVAANSAVKSPSDAVASPVKSLSIVPKVAPAKAVQVVATPPKLIAPKQDSIQANQPKKEYLYATLVRPNATGIINMRAEDNYSAAVIETIPGNSKVLVLQKGDAYYRISFDNHVGYVPKWALQVK